MRRRPASLVGHLASYGDRPALHASQGSLTYAELARQVAEVARAYAGARRLVLLAPRNDVPSVVEYLGALAADQVVLLTGEAGVETLRAAYRPDVVVGPGGRGRVPESSAHHLHPDLALLMTTSGSTGSPKLVRLGRDALLANATAIAAGLGIRADDVAATTLPLHYCYGLSVLHSHLLGGAALLLTEDSVLQDSFWAAVAEHRVTTIPGVPHTFELLERSGFAERDLPSLRCLTQAGGAMAPERVRAFAELGRRRGFDLFVMYGATEATARMAILPSELAARAPESVGLPLPGTAFTLAPADHPDPQVGELVFHGPNVMLGYAEAPADLARGRTTEALHTGDLARQRPDGLWEIVGRSARIAKVCGLRIDLDHLERVLAGQGTVVALADGGDRLVAGVVTGARPVDPARVAAATSACCGLPAGAVEVVPVADLPRLENGKVDHRALARLAGRAHEQGPEAAGRGAQPRAVTPAEVTALYARLLGRPDARATDSFVGLGGDSLSYVETSIRLERLVGHLPAGWPTMPAAALADAPAARRPGALVETNVLLRALAIVTIVGTHANLFVLLGGAHVLLAVAGFNLGRFQLGAQPRPARVRAVLRGAVRVAVPSVAVIGVVAAASEAIGWRQALLLTWATQWEWSEPAWSYWFIEALVGSLLVLAAVVAVPAVDRWSRRYPFGLPVALTLALVPARYDLLGLPGDHMHRVYGALWLVTVGWAVAKARTARQRWGCTAMAVVLVPGFFDGPNRHLYLVAGLLLLTWLPHLRVPAPLARLAGVLAASSLWTYLLHWQVYPHLEDRWPLAATVASLAIGVAAWWAAEQLATLARRGLGLRGPAACPRAGEAAGNR